MRNLKRARSLALAAMMLIGMMGVSAGAAYKDFTDKDEIQHTEAVNTLVALNIISGKEDGSYFDPTGIVTRAEMAKMITVALNGGSEPVLGVKDKPTFSDINGHWAEAYIEYCTSMKIISGRGNGTFDPNATVTVAEAAKMVLTALGYDADVFMLTGNNWQVNTDINANNAKLYKDLTGVTSSSPLTRDNAAQLIYNGLNAYIMVKSYDKVLSDGTISYNYSLSDTETLLSDKYGAISTEAAVLKEVSLDNKGTYTVTTTGDDSAAKYKSTFTKVEDDFTALLGQNVRVVYKMENGKTVVYGVFATDDNTVVTSTVNKIESVSGTEIKIDGTKYKLDTSLYNIKDNVYTAGALGLTKNATSFDTFSLIDNDGDEKYEGAVITTVKAEKVTYASSSEIIAGGVTYKAADNNIAEGIAKNDYVTIVYNIAADKYDIKEIASISGEVDGVKSINDTSCVRVNGEWYAKNSETMNVDVTYTFYAVNGVVVRGSVDASSADIANLIMVLDADTTMKVTKAMVMNAKGEISTVTIDSDGAAATAGSMYTFTETDKGYKLAAAATIGTDYTWNADGAIAAAGSPSKVATIGSKNVADDAVIFVMTNDGGKVITGKQFKNLNGSVLGSGDNKIATTAKGYYTSTVNGLDRVTYAGVTFDGKAKNLGVTSGNEVYAYVTSDFYTVSSSYTSYTIWNGTENATVVDKGANTPKKGDIITYDSIDGDGYISGVSKANLTTPSMSGNDGVAYVAGIEGKYLYLDGTADASNKYKITGDTKYLYVDSNASKAEEIGKESGEVTLADKYGDTVYMDNVIVLVNASGELELVVVDVTNNMTNYTNATATASINPGIVTKAAASLSKTSNIKVGDSIEVTFTATADGCTGGTVTVTNAKLADGTGTITVPALANGQTFKATVFAVGGAISFS